LKNVEGFPEQICKIHILQICSRKTSTCFSPELPKNHVLTSVG